MAIFIRLVTPLFFQEHIYQFARNTVSAKCHLCGFIVGNSALGFSFEASDSTAR